MTDTMPIRIALWGPSSAGKTMLIVQLYNQQDKAASQWSILPMTSSADFIDECRSEVLFENKFLRATARGDEFREYTYRFLHEKTGREALLSVDDRAGGDLVELSPSIREHLKSANGLILLFDPQQGRRETEKPIMKMLEVIQRSVETADAKYPHPIAVCLSKADTLIDDVYKVEALRKDPEGFVRELVGNDVINYLQRLCKNYRFFPISSVDIETRWGIVRQPVFWDETLTPRLQRIPSGGDRVDALLNPMNPFLWLFAELGAS